MTREAAAGAGTPILQVARLDRWQVLLLVGFALLVQLVHLPFPIGVMVVLDQLVPARQLEPLPLICLGLGALYLARLGAELVFLLLKRHLVTGLSVGLIKHLTRGVVYLPMEALRRSPGHAWVARIEDGGRASGLILQIVEQTATITLACATKLPLMLWISPTLGLLALLMVPLGCVPVLWLALRARLAHQQGLGIGTAYSAMCYEACSKLELFQGYGIAREVQRHQRHRGLEYARHVIGAELAATQKLLSSETLGHLAFAAVVGLGVLELLAHRVTPGGFLAFLVLFQQLSAPLLGLPSFISSAMRRMAIAERLRGSLTTAADGHAERKRRQELRRRGDGARVEGAIELQGVTFSYGGERARPAVEDVSFTVPAGEHVALVGPSGGGKTTLAKLIARLHEPTAGRILVDGRPLPTWGPEYNQQLGVMFQSYKLFPGTLRDNLAVMNPRATEDEQWAALERAHAAEFVRARPERLDTPVGMWGGSNFSLGQRQRLLFAALYLRDPRICVLDEATSALDVRNERLVLEHLMEFLRGRTTIFISHRLSAIFRVGTVLVLDRGRLVQRGSHDELARDRGGLYRRLLEEQVADVPPPRSAPRAVVGT